jgi:hypothetical protein
LKLHRALIALFLIPFVLSPVSSHAQDFVAAPPDGMPGAPPPNAAPPAPVYTDAQLDQMLAPVALYPDALLAQVLMAATYPLEVVEAKRWLQDPNNAALKGDQLAAALEPLPWDPSVKSLVPFPQVLQTMDANLQWTEQMGDAFLAQQPSVMNSVQRLRQQAQAVGSLRTTPQQRVTEEGPAIEIVPTNPQVVYVPVYNPTAVYGAWAYPGYPPYYFPPPPGYIVGGAIIGFGLGFAIVDSLWDWHHWDWGDHRIEIDNRDYSYWNRGRPPAESGVWHYDPSHRHGVPFRSPATQARFGGANASPEARRTYRGYEATPAARSQTENQLAVQHVAGQQHNNAAQRPSFTPTAVHAAPENRAATTPAFHQQAVQQRTAPQQQTTQRQAAPAEQRSSAAPAFESFSRGTDVRAQAQRGSASRATPAFQPSAQRSNAGGGNRGGGSGGGNDHNDERR